MHGWLIPEPGVLHLLMEKAELDLTTALQQPLLALKTRLKIARDVANGVKAIHAAHYIHQDIKADSILVSCQRTCIFKQIKVSTVIKRSE